jgi:hypothetical protein
MKTYGYAFAVLGIMTMLAACEMMGLAKAENFGERVVYAQSSINASTASVTAALNNGAISSLDAEKAKVDILSIQEGLDAAVHLKDVGDLSNAEDRLKVAEAGLILLRSYLVSKGVK